MASRTRPSLRLSCTGVQRSSLAIIARARRGEPGDEANAEPFWHADVQCDAEPFWHANVQYNGEPFPAR